MPILNMVGGGNKGGNIGEPLDLTVTTSGLDATIKWTDNEIGTIPPTSFAKSELVRKVGSAPTSPSDGTLVVTETVKDTYKTTGYVDQGLTDGETYYYRVFSYSDLGGISYCDAVSVTPSAPWQPGADCVAYYPFDTDTLDAVGTTTLTVTTSGIGLGTIDGVTALYNSGSGRSNVDLAFTRASVTSVFVWAKGVSLNGNSTLIGQRVSSGGYDQHRTIDAGGSTPAKRNVTRYDSGDAGYLRTNIQIGTQWTCVGYIETSSGADLYINGSKVATSSTPSTWGGLTYNIGIMSWIDGGSAGRPFNGYMSKLALYNAEKSEADYLAFYNGTKAEYGL